MGKTNPDIIWRFIPPYAPWQGAFWEHLLCSVKTPLKKIVGKAALTENELSTLLCKIEAQINSRPLTALIDSADQKHAITPAELINGRPLQQMDISDVSFSPRNRFLHLQKLQKDFWTAWTREYLPSLQQRKQWQTPRPNIKVGDLVLLLKENVKRHKWPLGRIDDISEGRDGNVRSVTVRTTDGETWVRPIQHLVLLEDHPFEISDG